MKYIYENMRMTGMQDHHGQWWKVSVDCIQCGKCCIDIPERFPKPGIAEWTKKNGECMFLSVEKPDGTRPCLLYPFRPHGTCTNNNPHIYLEYCDFEFEKIDGPFSLL